MQPPTFAQVSAPSTCHGSNDLQPTFDGGGQLADVVDEQRRRQVQDEAHAAGLVAVFQQQYDGMLEDAHARPPA